MVSKLGCEHESVYVDTDSKDEGIYMNVENSLSIRQPQPPPNGHISHYTNNTNNENGYTVLDPNTKNKDTIYATTTK